VRLECHGFCLSQLLRENEYKINYEETLNYLALFILPSFTIDKARFLQPSKKKKKFLRAIIFSAQFRVVINEVKSNHGCFCPTPTKGEASNGLASSGSG